MPVGVPKVPYRTPQEGSWQWVDLWNCLYRERIIFVGTGVTEDLGNQLVGTMLYLDSVSDKDMQIYINTCQVRKRETADSESHAQPRLLPVFFFLFVSCVGLGRRGCS